MEEARTLEIDVVSCIPMLRRYALKLARNGPDADDLVQDCLLRALSRQHQFEPGTNLLAWLTTILRNLFFTACQRKKRMVEVPLEPDAAQASHDAPQIHRIALSDTGRALEGLSADQKRVVQRCGVEGASYEDAALEMGVSVGTIRSRLSRARSYLREQVAGRIRPAYLHSRNADVRVENTRPYRIRRIERHAAGPEDIPAKQPEQSEHPRTPAEATLVYPLVGISNAANSKISKPLRMLEVTVEKCGGILLTGAGFPHALDGETANDVRNLRTVRRHIRGSSEPAVPVSRRVPNITSARATSYSHVGHPVSMSGLSAEQVGSRGGAPPRLFRQIPDKSGTNQGLMNGFSNEGTMYTVFRLPADRDAAVAEARGYRSRLTW